MGRYQQGKCFHIYHGGDAAGCFQRGGTGWERDPGWGGGVMFPSKTVKQGERLGHRNWEENLCPERLRRLEPPQRSLLSEERTVTARQTASHSHAGRR